MQDIGKVLEQHQDQIKRIVKLLIQARGKIDPFTNPEAHFKIQKAITIGQIWSEDMEIELREFHTVEAAEAQSMLEDADVEGYLNDNGLAALDLFRREDKKNG